MTTHSQIQNVSCSAVAPLAAHDPLLPNDEGFALDTDAAHEVKRDYASHQTHDDSPERALPIPGLTPRPVVRTYEPPALDHYVECSSDTSYGLLQKQYSMAHSMDSAPHTSHSGVDGELAHSLHQSLPVDYSSPQPHPYSRTSSSGANRDLRQNIAPHPHGPQGRNRHTRGLGTPQLNRSRKYSEGNIRDLYKVRQSHRFSGGPRASFASYTLTNNLSTAQISPLGSSQPAPHRYSVPCPSTLVGQSPTLHQAQRHSMVYGGDMITPSPGAHGDGRVEPWAQAFHAAAIAPGVEPALGSPGLNSHGEQVQRGGHQSQSFPPPAGARWGPSAQLTRSEDTVHGGDCGPEVQLSCDSRKGVSTLRVEPKVYWDVTPNYWYLITTALAFLCLASVVGVVYGGICFSYACHKYHICPAGLDMARNGCDKLGIEGSTVMLAGGFICGLLFVYGVFKRRRLIRKKEESRKLGYYGKFVS
ncbi:hypothetical protein H4R34_000324 [Dimargaris verticillata]|uniref:Uncharacterized protein n=1 Tax=Dimargaris verticillata TaxID=2761393 RepID=A0A9W8B6G9_9FUNG|nr:hypothetical protein H4R34_000324 [Dimargaris verticillata]